MKKHAHFKIYKPIGFLSQFITNQKKRNNKKLLGEIHNFPEGTMAIGRLDANSEGLLFLTTDGKLSEEIRSNKVEKEYLVEVAGEITAESVNHLQRGVEISINGKKYTTQPCKAHKLIEVPKFPPNGGYTRGPQHGPSSWVSITIREGKFRQVRKMTAKVGFPTLRLIRVRIGNENLNQLTVGQWVEVSQFHI